MTERPCFSGVDFDLFDSPEHQVWKEHRRLLLHIPTRDVWRGCLGLGLVVTHPSSGTARHGRFFVPDRDIRWVGLVDLPARCFRRARERETHWASVFRTRIRYGMPTIGGEPERTCDFRAMPFSPFKREGRTFAPGPDVLDSSEGEYLFRILNRLNLAMTATALVFRAPWRARRQLVDGSAACPNLHPPLLGDGHQSRVPPPDAWMPRPYLAFRHSRRARILTWTTLGGLADGMAYLSDGLKRRLCADVGRGMPVDSPVSGRFLGAVRSSFHGLPTLELQFDAENWERHALTVTRRAHLHVLPSQRVEEGDRVATDSVDGVPTGWHAMSLNSQWRVLPGLVGRARFARWIGLWFQRQLLSIRPGQVHVPAEIAAPAARGHAQENGLLWDLSPALDHYDEACDAFVFPTIRMRSWTDFTGVLPGEVAYDVTPHDPRFTLPNLETCPRSQGRHRRRRDRKARKTDASLRPQPELCEVS